MLTATRIFLVPVFVAAAQSASAGPPYVTDDPQPTDIGHFEIYAFTDGISTRDGAVGEGGIDFNYGAASDLQLTAVIPLGFDGATKGSSAASIGNVELAAKYKFLHQDDFGLDIAFFPRVFLPAGNILVGQRHTAVFLPVWLGRSWSNWTTFGGGGCAFNRAAGQQNFCQVGWALTRQITLNFQLGGEVYYQTSPGISGRASTGLGAGAIYDLNDHYHLMASVGPGIQNAALTNQTSWYVAILTTF